jgi:hypothetical protein
MKLERQHQIALSALGVYLVAAFLFFGLPVIGDLAHRCVCLSTTTDEGTTAWALQWWPHALLHGLNPFHPRIIYAPQGIDIAQGASMPGLALAFAPVTAIVGPLAAYNIAAILAPALAAWFAFLLCRRLTGAFWPSLVGGWLFGFSSYMLGQEVGHLNLSLVFLVPAIVHVAVRSLAGELSTRSTAALLTLALVGQFSLSTEVFATFTLFAALSLVVAATVGGRDTRASLRSLLLPVAIAYAATAVIVSPYLYYSLQPGGPPIDPLHAERFSDDLLAFVFPNPLSRLGGLDFLSTVNRFTAGPVEGAAYLGVPLLALVALTVRAHWRQIEVRTMGLMLPIVLVCSLGAYLHVDGTVSIRLPWDLVHRLPLLGLALPARFVLYATLIVGVLAAIGLSGRKPVPWVLAVLGVASLWPATNYPFWHSTPEVPALFSTDAYKRVLHPDDVVLVLPVGIDGNSMLWQAEAHLGFTMASGYVVPPNAPDPYSSSPIHPTLTYNAPVPHELRAAANFIAAHHVTVAVLSLEGAPGSPWPGLLTRLGWTAQEQSGALVLRPAKGS